MEKIKQLQPVFGCMQKYILYETSSYFYLIGCDIKETYFRVLKFDRCVAKPQSLDEIINEDPVVYSKRELSHMLNMINDGNKTTGGLKQVAVGHGIVGFVRFLDCYYITIITQKRKVGCIGSNYVYSIKSAETFAIRPRDSEGTFTFKNMWNVVNRKLSQTSTDESRYMGLFQFIDTSKDFFFSYNYDLTHTLQHNYMISSKNIFPPPPSKEMYEWNRYQTDELRACLGEVSSSYWIMPITHGFYQQRQFSLFGQIVNSILIARRSRYYAGTRYLKRGVSVHGKVANDCEMEQILEVDGNFTSYVQMRGSIPTYWAQETSVTMPKPPILVERVDPSYLATQEHFADLLKRYSSPIIVLDLVKQQERRPRESIVHKEFMDAVMIINESMPMDHKIRYSALDFSRMSKAKKASKPTTNSAVSSKVETQGGSTGKEWSSFLESSRENVSDRGSVKERSTSVSFSGDVGANLKSTGDESATQVDVGTTAGRIDVIRELEDIAAYTIFQTSIFCSTTKHIDRIAPGLQPAHVEKAKKKLYLEQRGVLRTNCIDCLDRTNVAQFAMGVRFLAQGLLVLGLSDDLVLDPKNAILQGLIDMFSEMGDKLALQYGGSEAHKKVSGKSSGKKQGELLTSIKRYYSNAFTDRVKQDAMNIFLGYFQPFQHEFALWDLESDYFLHNRLLSPPRPQVEALYLASSKLIMDKVDDNDSAKKENVEDSDSILLLSSLSLSKDADEEKDEVQKKYLIQYAIKEDDKSLMLSPDSSQDHSNHSQSALKSRENAVAATTADELKSQTASISSNRIWDHIIQSEKKKLRLMKKNQLIAEENQMWWKMPLLEFDKDRNLISSPPPKDWQLKNTDFMDRFYRPEVLTSFDDDIFLGTDIYFPVDATALGRMQVESSAGYWSGNARSIEDYEDRKSIQKNSSEVEEKTNPNDSALQDQFSMVRYVKDLGSIFVDTLAQVLIPDIATPIANPNNKRANNIPFKTHTNTPVSQSDKQLFKEWSKGVNVPTPFREGNIENNISSMYSPAINDENSLRVYEKYFSNAEAPELLIDEKNDYALDDFTVALSEFNTSVDDVKGMEQLSMNAYTHRTICHAPYRGLYQFDSATMLHGLISTALVNAETSILQCKNVVNIPDSAKDSIDNTILSNTKKAFVGIEEEISKAVMRFVHEQMYMTRELEDARIFRRVSSLSSETILLDYMCQFPCESIAADIDTIKFFIHDFPARKITSAMNVVIQRVEELAVKITEFKKEYFEQLAKSNGASQTNSGIGESKEVEMAKSLDNEIVRSDSLLLSILNSSCSQDDSSDDYEGYKKLGPDVYTKISNPYFICNEATVKTYTKFKRAHIVEVQR